MKEGKEKERKRGVKVFRLLSSEFLDNDWAVTVQRRSPPSETMISASFSLFISLHFSSFSFLSYYTHTQKKKKKNGSPPFHSVFYFIYLFIFRTFSKFLGQDWDLWLLVLQSEWGIFSEKMPRPTKFLCCVINTDLLKLVLSLQTIRMLWKNKISVVGFVVQALTNALRGVT